MGAALSGLGSLANVGAGAAGVGAIGYVAREAACCFGAYACRCFCSSLSGVKSSAVTRIAYAFLFMITSVAAWVMLSPWAEDRLSNVPMLKLECPAGSSCHGTLAVYRICFSLTVFHLLLGGILVGVNDSRNARAGIQNGYWAPKLLFWILFTVASFYIPNSFFSSFVFPLALTGSFLFILIQLILLIDFAYRCSESWVSKYEDSASFESTSGARKFWMFLLIGSSAGMLIAAVSLTGVLYAFFGKSGCTFNQTIISINLILCLAAALLAVSPKIQEANPKSGLLQSAVVVLYACYLITSAIANEPVDGGNHECNPLSKSGGTKTTALVLGTLFTFVCVIYSTSKAATNSSVLMGGDPADADAATATAAAHSGARARLLSNGSASSADAEELAASHSAAAVEAGAIRASDVTPMRMERRSAAAEYDDDDDDHAYGSKYPEDDERNGTTYSYSYFHLIFALASLYMAMLVTNWNKVDVAAPVDSDGFVVVGESWAAVWVKTVSSWFVIALYVWTLVAPVALPDREWY